MHRPAALIGGVALALMLAVAGLASPGSGDSAHAAALTPWTNYYAGQAIVHGERYTAYFKGTGPHRYATIIDTEGCRQKVAVRYSVKVFRNSAPHAVLYSKLIDGNRLDLASEQFNYGVVRFSSVGSLIRSIRKYTELSPARAAWQNGGKAMTAKRERALGEDLRESAQRIATYIGEHALPMGGGDPATLAADAAAFDVRAIPMRSVQEKIGHYSSGCSFPEGTTTARFQRVASAAGNGAAWTFTETDATDRITVGFTSSSDAADLLSGTVLKHGTWFRLVAGHQGTEPSALAAAAVALPAPK